MNFILLLWGKGERPLNTAFICRFVVLKWPTFLRRGDVFITFS